MWENAENTLKVLLCITPMHGICTTIYIPYSSDFYKNHVFGVSYARNTSGYMWENAENTLKVLICITPIHGICTTIYRPYSSDFYFFKRVFGVSDVPEGMRNIKLHTSNLCWTYVKHMYNIHLTYR